MAVKRGPQCKRRSEMQQRRCLRVGTSDDLGGVQFGDAKHAGIDPWLQRGERGSECWYERVGD